jgi:predicted RNase H-like nuclease (RuvC/YqgF family)
MKHRIAVILAASFSLASAYPVPTRAQQPPQTPQQSAQQTTQSQTSQTQGPQKSTDNSVADAARKARAQKKNEPAVAKTYTNDDLPSIEGGVSSVGAAPPAVDSKDEKKADASASTKAAPATQPTDVKKDEAYWRKRFSALHEKLDLAERELDVMQRELNLDQRQYYADPNQALQQQYSRDDINQKTDKITRKQKEVDDLKQQVTDLEDELRRAGGDPAWAR